MDTSYFERLFGVKRRYQDDIDAGNRSIFNFSGANNNEDVNFRGIESL
jgi:hypothetical protein